MGKSKKTWKENKLCNKETLSENHVLSREGFPEKREKCELWKILQESEV